MATAAEQEDACPITGFRRYSRNLIIAGTDDEGHLGKLEQELRSAEEVTLDRVARITPYERMPQIAERHSHDGKSTLIHLVRVDDRYGRKIADLRHRVQPYLAPFDSVRGHFVAGSARFVIPSKNVKVLEIKNWGKYHGMFSKSFLICKDDLDKFAREREITPPAQEDLKSWGGLAAAYLVQEGMLDLGTTSSLTMYWHANPEESRLSYFIAPNKDEMVLTNPDDVKRFADELWSEIPLEHREKYIARVDGISVWGT